MSERHWAEWTVEGYGSHIRTTSELLAEIGGKRVDRCAICKDTPRKAPKGDPCGNCGVMTVERVWLVEEADDLEPSPMRMTHDEWEKWRKSRLTLIIDKEADDEG